MRAVIHGGGILRYHDFRIGFAFSLQFTVQGLVRVAIEAQNLIFTVPGIQTYLFNGQQLLPKLGEKFYPGG